MIFEGSAVSLVTPFDEKNEINYFELKNLIEFQIACGTKAIILLGATGELSCISKEERQKIIKFAVCLVSGRIPVIVGTGSNSTKKAISLSKQAEELGADGVLVVTPYYNKCNKQGLYEHFKLIANSVKIPVILSNEPSRTGINLLPETVLKLSKIKNIVGLNEASGDANQIQELLSTVPNNFAVFSGDDKLILNTMMLGGKGAISVTANCYPEMVSNMCDFALDGDYLNAKRISRHLYKVIKALFLDINPICIKYYMNLLGFNVGSCRLPLANPSSEIIKILKETKQEYEN